MSKGGGLSIESVDAIESEAGLVRERASLAYGTPWRMRERAANVGDVSEFEMDGASRLLVSIVQKAGRILDEIGTGDGDATA